MNVAVPFVNLAALLPRAPGEGSRLSRDGDLSRR